MATINVISPETEHMGLGFLAGGGEMGERIRSYDWASTSLGAAKDWPQSLRTSLRIMLMSRQPVWVGWGKDLTYFYNDAYHSIIGGKHPWALGRPTREVWSEIWDVIDPMLQTALSGDEGTYVEDQLLIMERNGYPEETYYTFSYSPIPDDVGQPGGIFCANTDDTQRVIGQRELALLRDLSARTAKSASPHEASERSIASLSTNNLDVPFALIYAIDPTGDSLTLVAATGIEAGHRLAPSTVQLKESTPYPFQAVLSDGVTFATAKIDGRDVPTGGWPTATNQVAMISLATSSEGARGGVLVVGQNPNRIFDEMYRAFLSLVGGQISAAMTDAEATAQERQRLEALAALDQAKTAFFANISHEFRTPLTLMLGPLDDALDGKSGDDVPDWLRSELEMIRRNGLRLQKLVNALLEFSRLEAGRMRAMYQATDLCTFTVDLTSTFRSAIEKAGLELEISCEPLDKDAYVDRDLWEQLVLNLISNAFKHTFEGRIAVSLQPVGDQVELRVSDTGTGIDANELPHLFERFRRVEGARSRTHEGSGIGLALVQEIAKLHGGSIVVTSSTEGPDRGTTFAVTIPLGNEHITPSQVSTHRTDARPRASAAFAEEALRWLPNHSEPEIDMPSAPAPVGTPGGRLVVADDNADMREFLKRLLGGIYDVEAAADGQEALNAIRRQKPDLVLSDVMMPTLDGFGLLDVLRRDPLLQDLPVILLSARAGEEAQVEGLEQGADDYLVKPFSSRELLARVQSSLKLDRLRREAREVEAHLRREAEQTAARLNLILSRMHDLFGVIDSEYRYTFVSESVADFTGIPVEDLLGKNIWELFPALVGTELQALVQCAMEKRESQRFDYFLEGFNRWVDYRLDPLPDGGLAILTIDITERVENERDLERRVGVRTAELQEANREMEGFTYSVSHDLRAPLRSIVFNSSLLLEDLEDQLSDEHKALLRKQSKAARKLAALIDDLLKLSRVSRQAVVRESVDASAMAASIVQEIESVGSSKSTFRIEPGLVVDADPNLLQLVLRNLLENAAKFSNHSGTITVGRKDKALFVRDQGIGFDPAYAEKIFEPFERLVNDDEFPGTGIGLANVKRIVERHGGRAWAEGALGQGATFYFTLGA